MYRFERKTRSWVRKECVELKEGKKKTYIKEEEERGWTLSFVGGLFLEKNKICLVMWF